MQNRMLRARPHLVRWLFVPMLSCGSMVSFASQAQPQAQERAKAQEEQKKSTPAVERSESQGKRVTGISTDAQRDAVSTAQAEARKAETWGDWEKASKLHQQAFELAEQSGDREAQADASLKYARVCEWSATTTPNSNSRLSEAERSYRTVIDLGTPPQKRLAQNNLGALLLREEKNSEALRVLRNMSYQDVAAYERYVYDYNLGRAFEAAGQPET